MSYKKIGCSDINRFAFSLIKIFPIFSGFDLTFIYMWCMFYKIREGLKSGKVIRSATQREQSLAKMAQNLYFHTGMRRQSCCDERHMLLQTSLKRAGAISVVDAYFAIKMI
jgi:hypothetical protein